MGVRTFQINNYKLFLLQNNNGLVREIRLVSNTMIEGRFEARILFEETNPWESQKRVGYVSNLGTFNPGNSSAVFKMELYCDQNGFAGLYQVLSTEKPLHFFFMFEDKPAPKPEKSNMILLWQLSTDAEFPGDFETQ